MRDQVSGATRHFRTLAAGVAVAMAATACSSNGDNGPVGPPAHLAITAGDAINETVGAQVGPFAVKVTDSAGLAVAAVTVNFVASTGITLTNATAQTNQDGSAFTAGTFSTVSGARTITATVAGLVPVIFHATANTDVASVFAIVSGNNQSGTASTALGEPLAVSVTDQYGNGIPNVAVTFEAIRGIVGNPAAHTGADGRAQSTFTLPPNLGVTTVTATAIINSVAIVRSFTTTAN